jgi:IS30 family transposase
LGSDGPGAFVNEAAAGAGTYRRLGGQWLSACGGVRPRRGRNLTGRCLSFAEREDLAIRYGRGESVRQIAGELARSPSTSSRELRRNADWPGQYRAATAHGRAYHRASRPKPAKLAVNDRLRDRVAADLGRRYSPEQIAGQLHGDFPDQPQMRVCHETIYQALYVPSRGGLKQQLTRRLRTGRAVRKPCRKPGQRKNRIPNMINISQRPTEVKDRAVPGD